MNKPLFGALSCALLLLAAPAFAEDATKPKPPTVEEVTGAASDMIAAVRERRIEAEDRAERLQAQLAGMARKSARLQAQLGGMANDLAHASAEIEALRRAAY